MTVVFIRSDVFCDLLQYTHTENVIYLFYTIKIQMVYYWMIFGALKKKKKSADVIWRGFDAICVCVVEYKENNVDIFSW